jgi:hypothetical protein
MSQSSSSAFQIDDSLVYTKPTQTVRGQANWVVFRSVEGGSFTSNQSFNINVNSANGFLEPQKLFLKYKLSLTGGTSAGSTTISQAGGSAVIRNLTTSLGGVQIEKINNYNQYCSVQNKRTTAEHWNMLRDLEACSSGSALTTNSAYSNGRYIVHSLKNCIGQSNNYLPLSFIRGGMRIQVDLDTVNNLVASLGTTTDYQVSDVQIIASVIIPDESYLKAFQASLESGRSASMQTLITQQYQTALNASTLQNVDILCGFVQSLKSITFTQRASTTMNSSSVDAFANDTYNDLKQYSINIGSNRYPLNSYIGSTNTDASGAIDPTNLALLVGHFKSGYASIDAKNAYTTTKDCVCMYGWGNDGFGTGVQVADGKMSLTLEYNSAPTTGAQLDVFTQFDSVIEISASGIVVNSKSF